ncbi:proteoglycan 4b [Hoplias malabaricus]|uniref:proteoglycan 4b n=1 Tax=Hoplias malabaricus TaxID=27720 RepID=UPI00346234FA
MSQEIDANRYSEKEGKRSVLSEVSEFFPDHCQTITNLTVVVELWRRASPKDTREMSSSYLLLFACVLFTCSFAQKSCRGRCGEAYYRGNACQCDSECLSHKECCRNYESLCTTRDSCQGRCGELFKRGRLCHCDVECFKFNQCCPDYETQCTIEECSTEEENDDPEMTTPATEEDYDPEGEGITDAAPLPEVASGSESLPSTALEGEVSILNETLQPLLPTPPETTTQPRDTVTASELTETEGSSPPFTVELSTPLPSTTISSSLTSATPKDTIDVNDPPVPEEVPESLPTNSEPEQLSSNSYTPTLKYEVTSKILPTTQQPSDKPPVPTSSTHPAGPTTTVSEEHDQNTQTYLQSTLGIQTTPPTTILPNNVKVAASNLTEPKPSGPNQIEDTLPPETSETTTKLPLSEPSESTTSKRLTAHSLDTTGTTIIVKPTKADNSVSDPSYGKDPLTTPTPLKTDPSPTKAQEKPTKPMPKEFLDEGNPQDYQADANNDTNLCSGRPVNGLTTLRNGTIVVFRGHYFWTLNSKRNPGPPLGITDVWGIPSPIDTVFTRCNCQGKTYFFKGDNYWRFENGNMDPGFPKPISAGFGLGSQVTAALSMPQYRSRKESVFFFKRGGLAQIYSYRITPQCGKKLALYTVTKKVKRQADPELGSEIDIRKTWRGFPAVVSSAVSLPSTGGDGYKYYIFSRTKSYSLKMEGDTPLILTPKAGPGKQKSAKSWFGCPETQSS